MIDHHVPIMAENHSYCSYILGLDFGVDLNLGKARLIIGLFQVKEGQ